MRDHTEFILTALSSREIEAINTAKFMQNGFNSIWNEAGSMMRVPEPKAVTGLLNRSKAMVLSMIGFKRALLQRLLKCEIELNLTPTFVNHMINEATEFYRTLCTIQSNIPFNKTMENIRLHKIWMPDAAGHAANIAAELDAVETELVREAEDFRKIFDNLFIKANELGLMLERTGLENGALRYLNEEVHKAMGKFIVFLEKILRLRQQCKALGVLKPLVPDHMIREERYYLSRLQKLKSC